MARKAILLQNKQDAVEITWTNNTGAALVVGDIVGIKADSGFRIAAMLQDNIANGSSGQVIVRGRIRVDKCTSCFFHQGETAYWETSPNHLHAGMFENTSGTDFALGMVVSDASEDADKVDIDLNQGAHAKELASSSSSSNSSSSNSSLSSSSSNSSSSSSSSTNS